MNMRVRQPFDFANEINRFMENAWVNPRKNDTSSLANVDWAPAVDVKETETEFKIHADLPGVDKENIEVHMENNLLTISGKRESESKTEKDGYTRIERNFGSFGRCFTLPDTADSNNISAKMHNGVLDVVIPKKKAAQKQKIDVVVT